MVTSDGRVFTEEDYEGYGVFGGKDIFILIAELNNLSGESDDEKRSAAINLVYETHIRKDGRSYKQGTGKECDFFNWETPLPSEGGKTPNQLVKEGWERYYPNGYGDWNKAAENGVKLPKLFKNKRSIKSFELFPYPTDCPDQGYFY